MKRFALFFALMSVAGCVAPATPHQVSATAPTTIRIRVGDRIQTIPLEEYVLGSVLSEVSPVNESPTTVEGVFELQAILARTYALTHLERHREAGFDLCDGTHCQIYQPGRIVTSRFTNVARQAVARTDGAVLMFSGRPAEALYHSDCGGHTAAADRVWGGAPVAYLEGAEDDVPASVHRTWQFGAPLARLRAALNLDPRTAIGSRLDRVAVVSRDGSGRAAALEVRGERTRQIKGEDLRAVLNQTFGDRAVMSTRFSVTRTGTGYEFNGTGFGHGVGLCQVGAMARVRRGEPASLILAAYYPGTNVATLRASRRNPVGLEGPVLLKSP